MATKVSKEISDNTEEANEASLAGSGNLADAVKKLLKKGKERGFVTLDELNAVLPPERISSELIEDVMAQLNDMGINVVEGEEGDEAEGGEAAAAATGEATESAAEDYGRTDDPVRLYLREMGAVELLSREGEIPIAKRIEAGREMMISGICESPLTIQAILDWNEALKEGRLLLRDIIDLEATQGTENGDGIAELPSAGSGELADDGGDGEKATDEAAETEGEGDGEGLSSFDDEDNISLAAIEEKLKPQVIETFDKIAGTYAKLNKLQHQRLVAIEKGEEPSKQSEGKMDGYKQELVDLVRTVRFNNARLEQLVQQLYTLNRRLMGLEGRLLRLAVDVGLNREDFLERYYGHELDPNWYSYVLEKPPERKPEPPKPPRVFVPRVDPKEVARQQKLEQQRVAAEAKEVAKADKARQAAEKAEAAAAEKEAKRIAAEHAKEAAAAEKEKLALQKQKEREKAEALKAKEREKAQKEADRIRAAKQKEQERARAAADRAKAQAAAQKEREQAKREAERAKAQKAREAEQRKREAERNKKLAAQAKAKKPAAKPVKKAPTKPAAKKAAVKTVKKAAPAKKQVVKKPAAKKQVKKPAPKKAAGKKR